MPEFDRSVVLANGVTSTGVSDEFWTNHDARGKTPVLHVNAASIDANLQATLFYNPTSDVGSFWTNVGSPIISGGMYVLDAGVNYKGYRLNVNSVSSGDTLFAALHIG